MAFASSILCVELQADQQGVTPELNRPAAGWRTRASVAQTRGRRHDAESAWTNCYATF